MDSLLNLRTFLAVCRAGGFADASRRLHVSPSVVAKRIAQLERTVGAQLFARTTRVVNLTPAGERFQRRAATAVAEFEAVLVSLEQDDTVLEGSIRLMAPTTLTTTVLGPLLNEFMVRHPGIRIEVTLSDRTINPLESGHDMAISGRAATFTDVQAVPLCPTQRLACAAPSYLAAFGTPQLPSELDEHACIVFRPVGSAWRFEGPKGPTLITVQPRMVVEDHASACDAARRGLGIALLPLYVARADLRSGQLQEALPAYRLQGEWFSLQVPKRLKALARVDALIQWLVERLGPACNRWGESL